MKSFFVPTYIKPGKLSDEKLLVGLIAVTPTGVMVKYSSKRIQLAGEVVSPGYAKLVKEVLDQIQNKAAEVNVHLNNKEELHFEKFHVFNSNYFEYLKKYSQNAIVFGSPEIFNAINLQSSFASLYENLLNEKAEIVKTVKSKFHTKVKTCFKESGIEEKADIELKISPSQLAGIYDDTTISLISKNGNIFAAEAIDFNIGIPALSKSLNAYEVLINSLNQFSKEHQFKGQPQYHIINSTPNAGSEQEKLLNNIYKYKKDLFKIVPEDSIEAITSKIKKGKYKKFSLFLTEEEA